MANVIIDSSVAIKGFFTEPHSDSAVRLLDQFHRGDATFLVPDLFFAEIGNILWKKQRFQGIDAADVRQILNEILAIPFERRCERDASSGRVRSCRSLSAHRLRFAVSRVRTQGTMFLRHGG